MNHSLTAIIKDKRGNVLAIGKNSYTKTHPYQAKCAREVGLPEKIYLHAELMLYSGVMIFLKHIQSISFVKENQENGY